MKTKPGRVYINNKRCGFFPFTEFVQVQRGKDKGKIKVRIPAVPERWQIVSPESIKAYPVVVDDSKPQ
jgi:hypothetical protein